MAPNSIQKEESQKVIAVVEIATINIHKERTTDVPLYVTTLPMHDQVGAPTERRYVR